VKERLNTNIAFAEEIILRFCLSWWLKHQSRYCRGPSATGRRDQFHSPPVSNMVSNHERADLKTYLFPIHSAGVALIDGLTEESVAVSIDDEVAAWSSSQ
jgi:hypothetical protein